MGFFGSLLGGGLIRAGERFHEESDRQHELDKWQRSQRIKMYSDFMDKNWDNMNADQQNSYLNMVGPDVGVKNPKDMQSMVTAFKAIHSMIPQIQATPESMGPTQRPQRTSFDTALSPSEEGRFQQWKAQYAPRDSGADYDLRGAYKAGLTPDAATGHWPDTFKKPNHPTFSNESQYAGEAPEKAGSWQGDTYVPPPKTPITIGPLPQPASTLSPAIMAPSTGGTAVGPSLTPNQALVQQKADMAAELRRQRVAEIKAAGLGDYEGAALAHEVGGINVIPDISAKTRGETERYKVDKQALSKGKLEFFVVPGSTPGSSHVVNYRSLGGKLFDENTGEQVMLPPEAEPLQQKVTPIVNDAGDLNLINQQRAIGPGSYRSTIPGVGRSYHPPASSAANTVELSKDALDAEADYFRKTHDFSKWGMGAQAGVRQKIANRAVELDKAEGVNTDYAARASGWLAGNRNQKTIRSLDAVDSGLNVVLDKSKKFDRTEIGVLNDIILRGKVQLNDKRAIEFRTAVQGVIDDLASALSGGGATTDAARKQAKLIFNEAYSEGGLDSAINSVREVVSARRSAFASGTVYDKGQGNSVGLSDKEYGPITDAVVDGKPTKVRKNLKTGKYRRVD